MTRHYQVITVGESTIDAFMSLENAKESVHYDQKSSGLCFRLGEKIDVARYDFTIGGNATNVAVGLTRLGIKSTLCTEIGDDEFSLKIRNALAQEHIERLLVQQVQGPSNFSVIINYKGDRTLFVQDVARKHAYHFDEVSTDLIYLTSLGNEWRIPYKHVLDFAKEQGARIAFNPGSHQLHGGKDVVQEVIKHTQMLFVNKEEAEILLFDKITKKRNEEYVEELLTKLRALGPSVVVITDGKRGSYAMDENGEFNKHGLNDGDVVERTGAGDAYTSGFLAANIYGLSLPQAMAWGSWNSTSVVSKVGAQEGLLKKEQMEEKVGK